ncbi:unnamed protein product [Paramecium octaurelia]|uniref:Uncharacterized protein n=1 Tax=Paramecium octaurelia TaxID=43137 RepID=A0A8S1WBA5_PAROT|nr:unnamed protein product [Paramecium octaurelia]
MINKLNLFLILASLFLLTSSRKQQESKLSSNDTPLEILIEYCTS